MIDFSSISYLTLNSGDEEVSDGISTGGGIPFESDTIYTVYVCMYLCAFINVHGNPSMCVYVCTMYVRKYICLRVHMCGRSYMNALCMVYYTITF